MKSDIKRAIENAPQPVELSSGHILFDKNYMNTWRKDIDKGVIFDGDDRLFKEILSNTKIYGEYGCGNSTKWVLENTNAIVKSVETVEEIAKKYDGVHYVNVGPITGWGRPESYEFRDKFVEYTYWIWQDDKPDTVLVDGRFRVCCFLSSLKYADTGTKIIFDDYINYPVYHIVEKFVKREEECGRQCLFIVPDNIDYEELDIEINNFRCVMD